MLCYAVEARDPEDGPEAASRTIKELRYIQAPHSIRGTA